MPNFKLLTPDDVPSILPSHEARLDNTQLHPDHACVLTGSVTAPVFGKQAGAAARGIHAQRKQTKVLPDKVLQSFNTWAFKREQPADPSLMLRTISESIALAEPLPFVLYWGKGPRCKIDAPDIECLDFLATLARRVRDTYEHGAAVELIFTNTHAALNGHSPKSIDNYFAEVNTHARQRGFTSCLMSRLTQANGARDVLGNVDENIPEDAIRQLSASARKWYNGDGTAEQGALKYYRMNLVEKRAVELAFPRSIFITFNGSELRNLFPERLPIFYMYSLRRGVSAKPWFLAADATSCDGSSSCRCAVLQD